MKHENKKLGVSFTFPEEMTFKQAELYERAVDVVSPGSSDTAVAKAAIKGYQDAKIGEIEGYDEENGLAIIWLGISIGGAYNQWKLGAFADPNS